MSVDRCTKIVWLSGNRFGFEVIKEALQAFKKYDHHLITLSQDSKTVMYDGMPEEDWQTLSCKKYFIDRMNREVDLLSKISPDVVVMCGWRQIISEEILNIPKKAFIAFHPTILPWGRGPAPIINTILSGASKSGVSLFHACSKTDAGDIIDQQSFSLSSDENASSLYDKVVLAGKKLINDNLASIVKGNSRRTAQEESKAFTFKKLKLSDNEINLQRDSLDLIDRKIRALSSPYLGAYIRCGNKKLIIEKAKLCTVAKKH